MEVSVECLPIFDAHALLRMPMQMHLLTLTLLSVSISIKYILM